MVGLAYSPHPVCLVHGHLHQKIIPVVNWPWQAPMQAISLNLSILVLCKWLVIYIWAWVPIRTEKRQICRIHEHNVHPVTPSWNHSLLKSLYLQIPHHLVHCLQCHFSIFERLSLLAVALIGWTSKLRVFGSNRSEQESALEIWRSDVLENQVDGFSVPIIISKICEILSWAVIAAHDFIILVENSFIQEPFSTGGYHIVKILQLRGPFIVDDI